MGNRGCSSPNCKIQLGNIPFNLIFDTVAGIGISANTFVLLFYISTILLDHKTKLHDLITCHLAFVHIVMLLIPVEFFFPDMFQSLNFLNDFKCKALFYTQKVMRGLSICTTCLLSILQVITISPSTSWMAKFKHKFTHYRILGLFGFFWSINLSFSSDMIIYAVAYSNTTQKNLLNISKYCSLSPMNVILRGLFLTLSLSRDITFVGLMLLSSAYMVILLCRHQRRLQYLHSTSFSTRASPEKRATQSILLLVSCFVFMYSLEIILSSSTSMLWVFGPVIFSVYRFVVNVYATVSPLLLIRSDKRIITILQKF
ncbi:vomeronasal type-1 receptor 90-like [Carlito syrichta]|uniref:Vomeronasal type-1 receptor n=1 Tax=Carlito syrichta TaxID=1868482 RepID=A0A1U7SWX1_CARSF|nr:vomeronasal type-1 receptor 90-like [Carlito syrichta]